MLRRCIALFIPLLVVGLAAALASARPLGPLATSAEVLPVKTATVKVSEPVKSSGNYLVLVSVKARTRVEKVTVYVTGTVGRKIKAHKRGYTTLAYRLTLKAAAKKLTVRAVSRRPKVHLTMTLKLEGNNTSKPKKGSSGTAGSASTSQLSSPATSTGSTAPTGPPAITPPPPQAPNPYTHLVIDDEFDTGAGAAPSDWSYDDVGGVGECGTGVLNANTNSTANAAINASGDLAITAEQQNNEGSNGTIYPYTSAQLTSDYSFEYGSAQARIELPPGLGLCSSFWMVGSQTHGDPDGSGTRTPDACTGPACGEIDALEAPSFGGTGNPNNFGYPAWAIFTLHGPSGGQQFETNVNSLGNLSAGFHTYGVIWSPNSIVWTIDGVEYASATPATLDSGGTWDYNDRDFHLILDLAVGGWPCQVQGNANASYANCPSGAFPQTMLIDWVRVYQ
jgi:beta-glucanase (GH16 family)